MDTETKAIRRPRFPKSLPSTVAGRLRERIKLGQYMAGDMLPSERGLVEDLQVDRLTVRTAINQLLEEGLLERRRNCRPVIHQSANSGPDGSSSSHLFSASRLIALIMWHGGQQDRTGTAQQHVFWGMNETLGAAGYHSVFLDVGQTSEAHRQNAEREAAHLSYALNYGFGGMVFYPQAYNCNRGLIQEVSQRMPLVLLDRLVPGAQSDFVGSENRKSALDATWHLIDKGHKRIAFVTSGEYVNTVQERLQGYLQAVSDAFPLGAYEMVLTPPLANSPSWPMLDALCKLPEEERPTAIICVNNIEALRVANHLAQFGLSVPKDISLVGFDSVSATLPNGVGLTTVAQSFDEIGRAAANLILRRIQDRSSKIEHVELSTKLVECGSVRHLNGSVLSSAPDRMEVFDKGRILISAL